ncbi:hypothetical protein BC940DRAFT_292499 [Gongronella butleri]|nr:hypothetical protein BC940DRAFT_292499 [Gongronella butleri]
MSAKSPSNLASQKFVDATPLPDNVPKVDEVGATSAPLKSASFFIGTYCKDYNDDFMLCKNENNDPAHCLKEGRKVTRCAIDLIQKLRENCGQQFKEHWQCLENNNHELQKCRKAETALNACALDKLGLKKRIPGVDEQIHEKKNAVFGPDYK